MFMGGDLENDFELSGTSDPAVLDAIIVATMLAHVRLVLEAVGRRAVRLMSDGAAYARARAEGPSAELERPWEIGHRAAMLAAVYEGVTADDFAKGLSLALATRKMSPRTLGALASSDERLLRRLAPRAAWGKAIRRWQLLKASGEAPPEAMRQLWDTPSPACAAGPDEPSDTADPDATGDLTPGHRRRACGPRRLRSIGGELRPPRKSPFLRYWHDYGTAKQRPLGWSRPVKPPTRPANPLGDS